MPDAAIPNPGPELNQIATEWAVVFDSVQFLRRYAPAIQSYLHALIKNSHDAEDVAQDFFLRITRCGFPRAKRERGRFRDYLKVAVRNAALNFMTRSRRPGAELARRASEGAPAPLARRASEGEASAPPDSPDLVDLDWLVEWRRCLLNRAWKTLSEHRGRSPDGVYATVLRLAVASPEESSATLAERASSVLGQPIKPDAFRKQLSRARRVFAEILVKEVAETLDFPDPQIVEEELAELGLLAYVRPYLPAEWQKFLCNK